MPPFFLRPDGILATFGVILLSLGAFTCFDAGRRASLETAVLASALGDEHCYAPAGGVLPGAEVRREGSPPWRVVDASAREFPDAELRPDGMVEVAGERYVLYRYAKEAPGKPEAGYGYLKTGPGRFLAVAPPSGESSPR